MYPASFVSVTGEVTGFRMPERVIEGTSGRYVDIDFYATVNFTNNAGAQFGYRSFDLGYVVKSDIGDFKLKGFYFGGVVRYYSTCRIGRQSITGPLTVDQPLRARAGASFASRRSASANVSSVLQKQNRSFVRPAAGLP